MEALLSLLSQPITQLGAIVAIGAALQKYGIDVKGALRGALGGDVDRQTIDADNRNVSQILLTQMQELSAHFNHETTDNQKRIETGLDKLLEQQSGATQILKEIKEYGIKCRKE